ncbi:U3 small nucleolar RNA-associated protein 18 homolog [Phlebotomus papatasi]|uniref:U3 small nucleolar RNA-associated protein 18 homolog n=1 Tax=Phlebotomus papatasi TaxID=29031 RepID=UPI00248398B0|nr:U3 small nucleolar RNA-associated protein 18 homolog [Phlebotomus papatasi]
MEVAVKNETVESVVSKDDDDFLKLGFGSAEEGSDEEAEVPEISWFRELKLEEQSDKKDEKQEKKKKKTKRNPPSGPDDEEKELMEAIFGNKEKLFENLKEKPEKDKTEAPSNKRKHAWTDSDDEGVTIEEGLKKSHKQSFLLDPKAQYSKLLSNKYQKLVGTPKWAEMDRVASDSEDEELLKTVGHVLKGKKGSILENSIEFQRLKDLNRSTYCEGLVTSVEFHPTSTVALVSGLRGVASIYSIEKTKCEKLHSIQFEKFPLKCCKLSLDGSEAILGSHKKFFFSYNLITGQKLKYFVPNNATKMTNFEISPDGKLLALAGRFGEIHILNAITKEWIVTLKQEYEVTGMSFSSDSRILYCHSNDSEVSVFNLTAQKMMHRFYDDGCLSGTSITMSPNGKFLATGSGQGIVNIYGTEDLLEKKTPTPVKIFKNLVTSISSMAYNPSSELLGMCSREINDALRLAHFPSATIYANFPGNNLAKAKPNILRFSPGGRYMAVGNMNGRVSLYILKHYEGF